MFILIVRGGRSVNVGETIRTIREKSGLTQGQLAEKVYITQGSISLYETGKTNPTVYSLEQILNAMGYELVARRKR